MIVKGRLFAAVIAQLATCGWIGKGEPLCLIGDGGTGKSHLLIASGAHAAQHGYRVCYTSAAKLVNELVEAADDKQLPPKTLAGYGRVDLLCMDESHRHRTARASNSERGLLLLVAAALDTLRRF